MLEIKKGPSSGRLNREFTVNVIFVVVRKKGLNSPNKKNQITFSPTLPGAPRRPGSPVSP